MNIKLVSDSWDNKEQQAIRNVVKKGRYTMGPFVSKFEKSFAKKFNRKYAVMVNSGSSANLLSIASLFYKKDNPLKAGDEVIVPALAWSTTYFPLRQYNLKIRLCDIDLNTLNYDINDLKKKINKKTKLIVGVSILGNPARLDLLTKICKEKKIYLFEDNCESLGAKINKKLTGTFGELSTSSFFFSHHISTIEGGMISTNNRELYDIWVWRANLTNDTRCKISLIDPFNNQKPNFFTNYSLNELKSILLEVMKKLLYNAINDEYQKFGAMYILTALTIVSPSAAEAMPWYFSSVI